MRSISTKEYFEKTQTPEILEGSILIDVRSPEEYAQSHIPGAVNKPLDQFSVWGEEMGHYTTVFVNCRSGGRSGAACSILSSHGVNTINIQGGVLDWEQSGYTLEKS